MAQAEQTLGATALEVLGDAGAAGFWHERYLYSRAASVYGGTQQIQRVDHRRPHPRAPERVTWTSS